MLTNMEKLAAKACKQVWFDGKWGDEDDPTIL